MLIKKGDTFAIPAGGSVLLCGSAQVEAPNLQCKMGHKLILIKLQTSPLIISIVMFLLPCKNNEY
jgi:hypothetical protein